MEGRLVKESQAFMTSDKKAKAVKNTISYSILKAHNKGTEEKLKLSLDGLVLDMDYMKAVQKADYLGMRAFPENTTIVDDFYYVGNSAQFAVSAVKKFGGAFVMGL